MLILHAANKLYRRTQHTPVHSLDISIVYSPNARNEFCLASEELDLEGPVTRKHP